MWVLAGALAPTRGAVTYGGVVADHRTAARAEVVLVARGLALRPCVLLADEPTSELDAGTRDVVVALLAAEARAGAAVLLATPDSWCADRADAVHHLDGGRLHRVR